MDTTSPGYYSRLFLVPKPDGSFRPIIGLKKLNQFLIVPSFKMETLFSIIAALQPQEWITKIDLKDAYHHILVHINIRKYFRFVVAGVVYQFRVLPFGLSTAPREFTKTLAPVVQLLRTQGIRVHAYMVDWIIRAHSREQSLEHTQHTVVGRSTGTNQCYNLHEFWTFWVYISTWNEPLYPPRTLSYQLSPTSYPVCLLQQSCLLGKFHPSSAGCHISPRSYTTAVFTSGFSSSGSKPSGLNISNRGILQSRWMRTSSHSIYYMSNINELPDGILFHWFCKCTPPWMFLPLDIPSEYRPEHVTFGLLCVIFKFPSRIFCRRVPGFATDCPCGVWCRGLTTCLLYVGPPLEF